MTSDLIDFPLKLDELEAIAQGSVPPVVKAVAAGALALIRKQLAARPLTGAEDRGRARAEHADQPAAPTVDPYTEQALHAVHDAVIRTLEAS